MSSPPGRRPGTMTVDPAVSDSIVRMAPSQCHSNWNVLKDFTTARQTLVPTPQTSPHESIELPYPNSPPTSDCHHSTALRRKANNSNQSYGSSASDPLVYSNWTTYQGTPRASHRNSTTTPSGSLTSRNKLGSGNRRSSARHFGWMNANDASTWISAFYVLPPPTSNNLVRKGATGWSSHMTDTPPISLSLTRHPVTSGSS